MAQKYCSRCHQTLSPTMLICPGCGHRNRTPTPPTGNALGPVTTNARPSPPQSGLRIPPPQTRFRARTSIFGLTLSPLVRLILLATAALAGILIIGLTMFYYFVTWPIGPAKGYWPSCDDTDLACNTWRDFRKSHPFPYQAIAAKTVGAGKVIIVLSEPSASFDKSTLDQLARSAFAGRVSSQRLRWKIGEDGWLEDLVLTMDHPDVNEATTQADLRDGLAKLYTALFGTTYGGEVEEIDSRNAGTERLEVPTYHVTPKELGDWMQDPALAWQRVQGTGKTMSWSDLVAAHQAGAFISNDRRLVMLTFPASVVTDSVQRQQVLRSLRVPFREFAVASEGLVGGLWTKSGQIALVARSRTTSQLISAPLRYEMFVTLLDAALDTGELAQSYERTRAFAGKLRSGPYEGRDWAPVYLSPQLVDTEFGALLNVTDQMLKSWSSAGQVEYLYFDYEKPPSFPFGRVSLTDIVRKETGETSLLFNWNTAGSAVVVRRGDQFILTSTRSGSLPITYGAGGKTAEQGGAQLYDYEDKAYEYFSSLRDANLQRVVQYTVMYQLFRAVVKDGDSEDETHLVTANADVASDHADPASNYLVGVTEQLLQNLMANPNAYEPKEASATLQKFIKENWSKREQIAVVLSAPRSDEAKKFIELLVPAFEERQQKLAARQEALNARIKEFYERLQRAKAAIRRGEQPPVSVEQMAAEKAAIDSEQSSLEADAQAFMTLGSQPLTNARNALSEIAATTQDLDRIRTAYVEASRHEPEGSIRTPSIVLSWNNKDTFGRVGGHNLSSRTLRFEAAADVEGVEVTTAIDGTPVVRYNTSMTESIEEAAPELARAFEHRNDHDIGKLRALLNESNAVRSRDDALLFSPRNLKPGNPIKVFAKLGERVYAEKKDFIEDIRTLAAENDCCIYITHDAQRNAYIAEPNLAPPPQALVYEVLDTPSLVGHLRRSLRGSSAGKKDRATIFLDEPEGFPDAVLLSLRDGDADLATAVASDAGGRLPPVPPEGRVSLYTAPDFDGKRSSLKFLFEPVAAAKKALFRLAGRPIASDVWNGASIVTMDAQQVQTHLAVLKWDFTRDGAPVAVKVMMRDAGADVSHDISVIAGVDERDVESSQALLDNASKDALRDAAKQGASAGRYLLTVKDRLNRRSPKQLKRLVLVMKSGETKMYFTRLDRPSSTGHRYGQRDVG